jgi:hypothetical protein
MRDWVTDAIFASAIAGILFLWAKTGISPLVWLAWVCLHLETARAQFFLSLGNAIAHFRESYPRTRRDATGQIALLMLASDRDDVRYSRNAVTRRMEEANAELEEVQP